MDEWKRRLGCAIIEQAVADSVMNPSPKNKKAIAEKEDAIDFLKSNRLDKTIMQYGIKLSPEYFRRCLSSTKVRFPRAVKEAELSQV
jgi:hypothetical protein